jgi:ADP-heptose:LPS heptosyltransferase
MLRDAGFERRILHVSRYAKDIAEWARVNDLVSDVWVLGEPRPQLPENSLGIVLRHDSQSIADLKSSGLKSLFGPRTKVSSLWSYTKSFAQHRSRCEKSECQYNFDLVERTLKQLGIPVPPQVGLPALKVPREWLPQTKPGIVFCVSSSGQSKNVAMEWYLLRAQEALKKGHSVAFLVSGFDAEKREAELRSSGLLEQGAVLQSGFSELKSLIGWLSQAEKVVATGTGPLHLAHAAGVPVFGIYPAAPLVTSFKRWRPEGYNHSSPIEFCEF